MRCVNEKVSFVSTHSAIESLFEICSTKASLTWASHLDGKKQQDGKKQNKHPAEGKAKGSPNSHMMQAATGFISESMALAFRNVTNNNNQIHNISHDC